MTKKQLMVIIHKDTHYKISDNSDRVVQDLHGWYHPKFIELCKQYNIDYQLTEYEGYGDIFLGRFAQDKDDTERDDREVIDPITLEVDEQYAEGDSFNFKSALDKIRQNQAVRSGLVEKGIIQDNEPMLANKGGLAGLFRVKNQ